MNTKEVKIRLDSKGDYFPDDLRNDYKYFFIKIKKKTILR